MKSLALPKTIGLVFLIEPNMWQIWRCLSMNMFACNPFNEQDKGSNLLSIIA